MAENTHISRVFNSIKRTWDNETVTFFENPKDNRTVTLFFLCGSIPLFPKIAMVRKELLLQKMLSI